MSSTTTTRRAARAAGWRSPRWRALLALGVGASVAVAGTMAAWTDSAVVGGVTLSTGTVNLQVAEGTGGWQENIADSTVLDMSAMLPGQSTAGIIKVKNIGSGPLSTSLVAAATSSGGTGGTLHDHLVVKVTADSATTTSGTSRTCAGTAIGTGTSLNSTLLPASALAADATRTYCVQIALATTAPSTLQGASTTATLTFNGTT